MSDAGAEASRAADGDALADVAGRMEERDAAQEGAAGPIREDLHEHLGARPERSLRGGLLVGLDRGAALPVAVAEAGHDLARPAPHRIAVVAQSAEVSDLTRSMNIDALREYRDAVGKRTREIVGGFQPQDWEGQIPQSALERAAGEGAFPPPMVQAFTGRPRVAVLSGIALFHPAAHFGEATTVRSAGGFGTGI